MSSPCDGDAGTVSSLSTSTSGDKRKTRASKEISSVNKREKYISSLPIRTLPTNASYEQSRLYIPTTSSRSKGPPTNQRCKIRAKGGYSTTWDPTLQTSQDEPTTVTPAKSCVGNESQQNPKLSAFELLQSVDMDDGQQMLDLSGDKSDSSSDEEILSPKMRKTGNFGVKRIQIQDETESDEENETVSDDDRSKVAQNRANKNSVDKGNKTKKKAPKRTSKKPVSKAPFDLIEVEIARAHDMPNHDLKELEAEAHKSGHVVKHLGSTPTFIEVDEKFKNCKNMQHPNLHNKLKKKTDVSNLRSGSVLSGSRDTTQLKANEVMFDNELLFGPICSDTMKDMCAYPNLRLAVYSILQEAVDDANGMYYIDFV